MCTINNEKREREEETDRFVAATMQPNRGPIAQKRLYSEENKALPGLRTEVSDRGTARGGQSSTSDPITSSSRGGYLWRVLYKGDNDLLSALRKDPDLWQDNQGDAVICSSKPANAKVKLSLGKAKLLQAHTNQIARARERLRGYDAEC